MTTIDGQGDLLTLLEPEVTVRRMPSRWMVPCAGCGTHDVEVTEGREGLTYWPGSQLGADHPVCSSMFTLHNHVLSDMLNAAAVTKGEVRMEYCCYGKEWMHGKSIKYPTRDQWLDHARSSFIGASRRWARWPGSLARIITTEAERIGINPTEVTGP